MTKKNCLLCFNIDCTTVERRKSCSSVVRSFVLPNTTTTTATSRRKVIKRGIIRRATMLYLSDTVIYKLLAVWTVFALGTVQMKIEKYTPRYLIILFF